MKYSSKNKPLVCMQTQSTCYKGTSTMIPKGILWHSTGANNPTLRRYVQPSDTKPAADTYSKAKWLEVLGKNTNGNDWNHIKRDAGLNAWIGKLANGTVTSIQTMPWDFKPWGCGSGKKGSCNNGWMQFEICEDNLTDKNYFNAVYQEACELTAYYCQMYDIDPKGTTTYNGVKVPTILCHQDSYKLGLGSNHSDIYHWFKKHGKTMDDVRNDVAAIMGGKSTVTESKKPTTTTNSSKSIIYQTYDDTTDKWLPNVTNNTDYAGIFGHPVTGVYANLSSGNCVYKVHTTGGKWLPEVKNREDYAGILSKPIDGFMIKGDCKIHYQVHIKGGNWLGDITGYNENDSTYGYAGILGKTIDGIRMWVEEEKVETPITTTAPVKKYYRVRTSWLNVSSQKGAYTNLPHAIECCQFAGKGYKVFDWNGKVVYEYKEPEVKTPEVKVPEVKEPSVKEPTVKDSEIKVPEVTSSQTDVKTEDNKVTNEVPPVVPESTPNQDEVESKPDDVKIELDNGDDNQEENEKTIDIMGIIIKVINFIVSLFKKN